MKPGMHTKITIGLDERLMLAQMSEADHRRRTEFVAWLIRREHQTRDPLTGQKISVPAEESLRQEIADLRERIGRLEGAITVLMTDRKNRSRYS